MEATFTLEIPADEDGFILLECPKCHSQFRVTVSDFESDENIELWCPSCGLVSESYFTDDVIELAQAKAVNMVMNEIHSQFKALERKTKGGIVSFKTGKKPSLEPETPIEKKTDSLVIAETPCCFKPVKIPYREKESIYYCPFCGRMHYAN